MKKTVRKAIIPAAGLGTRFLHATKSQPKEMLPIVDKPTLQYIIEEAINFGIEEILIVTGRSKKSIEDHFDRSVELELEQKGKKEMLKIVQDISNMVNIHYIRQKEPKGLGHDIYCAKSFIGNEPFEVLLGDDIVDSETPCLKQSINIELPIPHNKDPNTNINVPIPKILILPLESLTLSQKIRRQHIVIIYSDTIHSAVLISILRI